MKRYVFHIALPEDWEEGANRRVYAPPSLASEGFIHFSSFEQLTETARRYFPDSSGLVLLQVEAAVLGSSLRFEVVRGTEEYPHLYRELLKSEVSSIHWLAPHEDFGEALNRIFPLGDPSLTFLA